MSGLGWGIRLGATAVLIAAAGALAVVLFAHSGSSVADPTAGAHRARAVRETHTLLDALALPAGAAVSPAPATTGPAVPTVALGPPSGAAVISATRRIEVPAPLRRVRAALLAHPPRGTRTHDGATPAFTVVDLPTGLAAAEVQVSLVADGRARTLVVAEATVRYLVPRAGGERVPDAARELVITRGRPGARPGISLRITDPAQVRRIATLVNRLAVVQPGVVHCPLAAPGVPIVTLSFRGARAGPPLAVAAEAADDVPPGTACDPLRFTVHGVARTPLLGGAQLLRTVSRLLGVRLWLAPYAA